MSVTYNQQVTNTRNEQHIEQKNITIYQGPRAREIKQALEEFIKQQTFLAALRAKKDEEAFQVIRDQIGKVLEALQGSDEGLRTLRQIQHDLGALGTDLRAIRDRLEQAPTLILGVVAGWKTETELQQGMTNGAFVRLDADWVFASSDVCCLRHALFVAFPVAARRVNQRIESPDGSELEQQKEMAAWQVGADLGYTLLASISPSIAISPYAALGAAVQVFSSGLSTAGEAAYGLRVGAEGRFGEESGLRVGLEWGLNHQADPLYRFDGLVLPDHPDKSWSNRLGFYVGGFLGVN